MYINIYEIHHVAFENVSEAELKFHVYTADLIGEDISQKNF